MDNNLDIYYNNQYIADEVLQFIDCQDGHAVYKFIRIPLKGTVAGTVNSDTVDKNYTFTSNSLNQILSKNEELLGEIKDNLLYLKKRQNKVVVCYEYNAELNN